MPFTAYAAILDFSQYIGTATDAVVTAITLDNNKLYICGNINSAQGSLLEVFAHRIDLASQQIETRVYGGLGGERAKAMVVDSQGIAYISGELAGNETGKDLFVWRLDFNSVNTPPMVQLLRGDKHDEITAMVLKNDQLYLSGWTTSTDLIAGQAADVGGDAYVMVYAIDNPTNPLSYTDGWLLSAAGKDAALALAVDDLGSIFIAGLTHNLAQQIDTTQTDYLSPEQTGTSAFVARFAAGQHQHNYLAVIGGSGTDHARAVTVDNASNIYIAGNTDSANFPITTQMIAAESIAESTMFLLRLNPTATDNLGLGYAKLWGGSKTENVNAMLYDAKSNSVFVAGDTLSADIADVLLPQALQARLINASKTLFVTQFSADKLLFGTLLGGSDNENNAQLAINDDGLILVGASQSLDFAAVDKRLPAPERSRNIWLNRLQLTADKTVNLSILPGDPIPKAMAKQIFMLPVSIEKRNAESRQTRFYLQLPAGLTYVDAGPDNVQCSINARVLSCFFTMIGNQKQLQLNFNANANGRYTLAMQVWSDASDEDPKDNIVAHDIVVGPMLQADIGLAVSTLANPTAIGNQLRIIHSLTNKGPDRATKIQLRTTLDDYVELITLITDPPGINCEQTNRTIDCTVDQLDANQTAVIILDVTPNTTGSTRVVATISANENDTNSIDNKVTIDSQVGDTSSTGSGTMAWWLLLLAAGTAMARRLRPISNNQLLYWLRWTRRTKRSR